MRGGSRQPVWEEETLEGKGCSRFQSGRIKESQATLSPSPIF